MSVMLVKRRYRIKRKLSQLFELGWLVFLSFRQYLTQIKYFFFEKKFQSYTIFFEKSCSGVWGEKKRRTTDYQDLPVHRVWGVPQGWILRIMLWRGCKGSFFISTELSTKDETVKTTRNSKMWRFQG